MKTNFALMQHHNYSLSDIENLMPWEREIYLTLLMQWIEEENERINLLWLYILDFNTVVHGTTRPH